MKRFILLVLGLSFVVIGGLYIVLNKKPTAQKHVLRFALPLDIPSFDINSRGHDVNADHVKNLLFEGLMRKDKNGDPQLAIAHKVDLSEDQKKYTFHLRDCHWNDGVEVSAYDFEYSWKRAINPNSKYMSQVPYYFYTIKDAKDCFFKKISVEELPIRAIDAKTLEVELEYPNPYFLHLISSSLFFPIPKHVVERDERWATRVDLTSNGPFTLHTWKQNDHLKLKKNSHYWNRENIAIQEIEIPIILSTLTAFQMFEKGELDWFGEPFNRVQEDLVPILQEKQLLKESEGAAVYWLFVNTEKYPLNNKKLRQALSYVIDRQLMVDKLSHGFSRPARGVLSLPLQIEKNVQYFKDDIAYAQQLFQEALKEMGIDREELPILELSCATKGEGRSPILQFIQEQWKKHLGVTVSLKESEWACYFIDVEKGKYDIGLMGWIIPCPNPEYILKVFEYKTDLTNKSFWENKEFQRALQEMRIAEELSSRNRATIDAERILIEDMPVIPLTFPSRIFAHNERLKGAFFSPFSTVDFTAAYFE